MARSFMPLVASRSGLRISSFASSSSFKHDPVPAFLVPSGLAPLSRRRIPPRKDCFSTRYASTTAPAGPLSSTLASKKQQVESLRGKAAINPPASTRPPVLKTPDRDPSKSVFAHYFATGKAFIAFYKSGVYAVWTNWKTVREIRRTRLEDGKLKPDVAVHTGVLTRSDWLLIRRSQADVKKIPWFGLVLMVCGEFTPLVVIAFSGVVPKTCQIPRQVQKGRDQIEKRRQQSWMSLRTVQPTKEELDMGRRLVTKSPEEMVKPLRWEQVLHVARSLGLYAKLWDTLWDYPPEWLLRRRVQRAVEYIRLDDEAISTNGKVSDLEPNELRIAAEDRGIRVVGHSDAELVQLVETWLKSTKQQAIPYLVLTKPAA